MPRGRMLSLSISYSVRIESLSEWAQLLFDRIVIHADDWGRLEGNPAVVRAKVKPMSPRPVDEFARAIAEMIGAGALVAYTSEGKTLLQVTKHDEHQTGLHKRSPSRYADPESCPKLTAEDYLSGNFRELPGKERTEEKEREGASSDAPVIAGQSGPKIGVKTDPPPLFPADPPTEVIAEDTPIPADLGLAAETYNVGASALRLRPIRPARLASLVSRYRDACRKVRQNVPEFTLTECVRRLLEQRERGSPFFRDAKFVDFEWLLKREHTGTTMNAEKVWNGNYRDDREPRNERPVKPVPITLSEPFESL